MKDKGRALQFLNKLGTKLRGTMKSTSYPEITIEMEQCASPERMMTN